MSILRKIKLGGSPSPNDVTVNFMSLSAPKPPPITVKKNTTYGEVFNKFFETAIGKGFKEHGGRFVVKSKIVNTIEQLEERITENVSVFISKMNPVVDQIAPLIDSYNNKTPWPPAKNYFDVDPIGLKKVGKMNTGETRENSIRGTTNEAKNMIITSLGPTTAQRTAYNKKTLLNWFETSIRQGNPYTLPDNRHPITPAEVQKIRESRGNFEVIDIGVRRASPVHDVDYYVNLYHERIDRGHMQDLPQARILELARNAAAAEARGARSRPVSGRSSINATPSPRSSSGISQSSSRLAAYARDRNRTMAARPSLPADSGRSSINATPSTRSSTARSGNRNLPNGSHRTSSARTYSGRSSISATPSTASPAVSPRSRARAAAITRENASIREARSRSNGSSRRSN